MPIYDYKCPDCSKKVSVLLPLARYNEQQFCTCGCLMNKLVTAPAVHADYPGYVSPATGKWVEGKRAHMEDLKRSNCRILEPGESAQSTQKVKERQEKLEKEIDVAVEKTAAELGIGN